MKIRYSLVVDIKTFFQTLRYKKWLDDNGYFYYLFDKSAWKNFDYKKISKDVKNEMVQYEGRLKEAIDVRKEYEIFLTRFGTFGSYELPNKVFVNMHRKPTEMAETIVHELVHLAVEPEVEKERMTHEQKERLVSDLVDKILEK